MYIIWYLYIYIMVNSISPGGFYRHRAMAYTPVKGGEWRPQYTDPTGNGTRAGTTVRDASAAPILDEEKWRSQGKSTKVKSGFEISTCVHDVVCHCH